LYPSAFRLRIEAKNPDTPRKVSSAVVDIIIENVNDREPEITENFFYKEGDNYVLSEDLAKVSSFSP